MQPSLLVSIISAVISVAAVTISLIALWKTHFAKFRPICTIGDLCLRIYPIRSERENWFIPSLDVPVSIANEGARPGKVLGLRISVSFPNLPIPGNREIFYPIWEVAPEKFRRIGRNRFQWIDEATLGEWMPFVVLPKTTVTKHLVFESRWTDPVIQNEVSFSMEIYTESHRKWTEIGKWQSCLSPAAWSELTIHGTSIGTHPIGAIEMEEQLHPPDLHKYTGTKEPIPEGGFGAGLSYLDYPDDEDAFDAGNEGDTA